MGRESRIPSYHPLVSARMALGLSQAQLLARILDQGRRRRIRLATNRSTLSRWEHGYQTPDHAAQLCIADALGVPAAQIDRLSWPDWLPRGDATVLDLAWTTEGALTALRHAAAHTGTDTRGFPIAQGSTLVGLVARALMPAEPRRTPPADAHLPRAWEAHRAQANEFRDLYRAHGGERLHGLVHESLRHQEQLLAAESKEVSPERFATSGAMAEITGWIDFDCQRYAAAQTLLITALRAAHIARQPHRVHSAAVALAMQGLHTGSPRAALDVLHLVEEAVRPTATPRTRALIQADLARAYAKLGEPQGVADSLDRATAAYAEATDVDDDPEWSAETDQAALDSHAGIAYLDLGRPADGVPLLARAVDARRHSHARERASYTILLARAHHLAGHPDEANRALDDSQDLLAHAVSSPRLRAAAAEVRRHL